MYIMYVDESGDPGHSLYGSEHFILSGLVIHQKDWETSLNSLKYFRKTMSQNYGFNQRLEIHASEMIRINKEKKYQKIHKSKRISVLKDYCTEIPNLFAGSKVINICIKKSDHTGKDIFELAWSRLLQRYSTFITKMGVDNELGIMIVDDTDSLKLQNLQRKLRTYNPIPSNYGPQPYNAPLSNIIEDSFSRESRHSYFIQTVDVIAHLLYRREYPKGSLKKYGIDIQFDKLKPILLKEASGSDPNGIVHK